MSFEQDVKMLCKNYQLSQSGTEIDKILQEIILLDLKKSRCITTL